MLKLFTFLSVTLLTVIPAISADWFVTTADFHSQPITLHSITADGLHVASTQPTVDDIIPFDHFISAQRLTTDEPAAPKFTLLLAGGDRLVGEPVSVASEKLTWSSPTLGSVPVSFSRLVAIGRGSQVTLPDEPPKQDVVTLANGDTIAGVFSDCADGKITIQTDNGATPVPLANVSRIAFAAAGPAVEGSDRAFRLRLTDGSAVTAVSAVTDGDHLNLTLPGKNAPTPQVPLANLLSIEQLNGPVSWLSSHTPTESVQIPYLGGAPMWPARFDAEVDGSPLQFDAQSFDHGIGVHAYSRLTFTIDPQWSSFRTQFAIASPQDQPSKFAEVTVRIKVDGKVVHEQQHFRAGTLSPVIHVDLKDAKTLTLECDYGSAGDTEARLNWLQPALLRVAAAATAP
jgi:hypothetical protein